MKKSILGIDSHAHVFLKNLPHAEQRRYTPDYDATPDEYFTCLASAGFSHGVLVQPSFLGTDNSYLLAALASAPDRLRGVAVIGPEHSMAELEEMRAQGVTGVRLNLIGQQNPDIRDRNFHVAMEKVASLGWHVELHQTASHIPELVRRLLPYEVTVVVDHFGRPDLTPAAGSETLDSLLALSRYNNIMVKASGLYRLCQGGADGNQTVREMFRLFIDAFSKHRLLIGSDWPHTQFEKEARYQTVMAELMALASSHHAANEMTVTNACALYKF
ncbi:amidohydrolase family protein [Klebsiella pneumoniae]|nr:amidohydrolase family protein [Klebsiella pneumoniae]